VSIETLVVILAMALATYGLRAGGLLLAGRLPKTGRGALWLRQIPPAVLASIVAPAILSGGPAEAVAAMVTATVAIASRNLFAAMAAGVATVWSIRTGLGLG
jgi:branched chain amino acid efflux pump